MLGDVAPDVLLGPVGERVGLPHAVLVVPARSFGVSARVGDWSRRRPVIQASTPASALAQRRDLADRAAAVGVALPQRRRAARPARRARSRAALDLDAVALLDALPGLVGLGEQHAGVEREEARVAARSRSSMSMITDSSFWKEQATSSALEALDDAARGPPRRAWSRLDRALALAPDDLEGHVAVPVDEVVHGLEAELDRQREVA